MNFVFESAEEAWISILNDLSQRPLRTSRNGDAREIIGSSIEILNPDDNFILNDIRKVSQSYAHGELAWYLGASDDLAWITKFAPSYGRYSNLGRPVGAYGRRIHSPIAYESQLVNVCEILAKSPDTRQAVISIFHSHDNIRAHRGSVLDIPCTLSLQFVLRDNLLNLIVTMRSNDVWMGFPYDVFCFTSIQQIVADILHVGLGRYIHNVGSLHLYEKHRSSAIWATEKRMPQAPHVYTERSTMGELVRAPYLLTQILANPHGDHDGVDDNSVIQRAFRLSRNFLRGEKHDSD